MGSSKLYQIEITEVRYQPMIYIVEADSPKEAKSKARDGDTVEERSNGGYDVVSRESIQSPVFLSDQDDEEE